MIKNLYKNTQSSLTKIIWEKELTKEIYPKFYLRKTLVGENKSIQILDKGSSFVNIKASKDITLGSSCVFDITNYVHTKNNALRFEYISPFLKLATPLNLNRIYSLFYRFNSKNSSNLTSFLIHKRIESGFESSGCGVSGFLPKKHGQTFFKKINSSLKSFSNLPLLLKRAYFFRQLSTLKNKMIVYRAKGKLKARSGLGFLQKKTSFSKTGFNKNKNLNYIFTISELNKFSYANKKRNQIKTFKSKNSGTKFFSDKSDFKRKKQKFSSKKNFKTGN